jgi:hypothetical protein
MRSCTTIRKVGPERPAGGGRDMRPTARDPELCAQIVDRDHQDWYDTPERLF